MGSHVVVFKREVRGPTMFQASRLKFLAILLFASHAIAASISSSDGASSGHETEASSFEFSHSHNFGASLDSFRERTDPVQIVVDDLDDVDSTVETVQDDMIVEQAVQPEPETFSAAFQPITEALQPFHLAVQPIRSVFNTPMATTANAFTTGARNLLGAKAVLAAPFVKLGAAVSAPFVKLGAKKIALIMKGGVIVGAKLLKGAALKTKIVAAKAGLVSALLGKKAAIIGGPPALKGAVAAHAFGGAPFVLVPSAATAASNGIFTTLGGLPGLNSASGLDVNVDTDQVLIVQETDGLEEDTNTVILDADFDTSIRVGQSGYGGTRYGGYNRMKHSY